MTQTDTVRFYEACEVPFGLFCNYSLTPIVIQGLKYQTVEHFYQAAKIEDPEYRALICKASTPNKAKILASLRILTPTYKWREDLNRSIDLHLKKGVHLRADWEKVKDGIMLQGLEAKFSQNQAAAQLLRSTGAKLIIENSPRDWYWGCGSNGQGQNKLGKLLMQVRESLKITPTISPTVSPAVIVKFRNQKRPAPNAEDKETGEASQKRLQTTKNSILNYLTGSPASEQGPENS